MCNTSQKMLTLLSKFTLEAKDPQIIRNSLNHDVHNTFIN